ncbi:MAG: LamG-like jellyroll fold domain-containing protein [Spirochaetaceae bacterium]
MAVKQTVAVTILILLVVALGAQERTIRIGGEAGWSELGTRRGVELRPGRRGRPEVRLAGAVYPVDSDTDLLLHFDEDPPRDQTGTYEVTTAARTTDRVVRRGAGAAVFQSGDEHLRLRTGRDGLFTPDRVWGDFTIEFWLYPTRAADGETILLWEGGRSLDGGSVVPQQIRIGFSGGALQWRFRNVFVPPDRSEYELELVGRTRLVPRRWQHHMLRYDRDTGLVEYLRDGRAEDIAHATGTGTEGGEVYVPYVGSVSDETLEIGRSLTGFLDELRISSAFRDPPEPGFHEPDGGSIVSDPLDLGSEAARLLRLEADYEAPDTSAVHFFYRTADSRSSLARLDPDEQWEPFEPGREIPGLPTARFVQVRAELYPDGERMRSPRLFGLDVVYEPARPPAPPTRVVAVPGDGEVTLRWDGVPDDELRGYTVFYGTRTGRYFGTGAEIGDSPVRVGERTEVTIDGLDNGTLYYFAVASRGAVGANGESVLSSEVTARPSRLGR